MVDVFLRLVNDENSSLNISKESFERALKKSKYSTEDYLVREKISLKLEKEIFNKIIKYNYTNKFDLNDIVNYFFIIVI